MQRTNLLGGMSTSPARRLVSDKSETMKQASQSGERGRMVVSIRLKPERRLVMNYVGLDVGLRKSSLHILDSNGKTLKRKEVGGGWGKLIEAVRQIPRPFTLCYEASCGYGYRYDHFSPLAERGAVGHPGQLRLIFRAKRKNNRVDAEKLAKLLYLDAVSQVYVPSVNVRAWRALIEFRRVPLAGCPPVCYGRWRSMAGKLEAGEKAGLWCGCQLDHFHWSGESQRRRRTGLWWR